MAAVLLVGGCATLPESGGVHRESIDPPGQLADAPYFTPSGPAKDGTPAAIVSGFLVAMRANPLSMSVARTFLSARARTTWEPNRGTLIYETPNVETTAFGARVRLTDTRRLDPRGGWLGGRTGGSETLALKLVSESGQWRIDNPPDALVVPTSYFERNFARFNLYFFDQTGEVLLPDPIFIPRGEQTATNLVRGLLAGPGSTLGQVTRSAIPSRTTLDLSVVVTVSGVAEVPVSRDVLGASPGELGRMMDQLAWTLRQVPGISRIRLTVDGAPVPLPAGRLDVSVSSGEQYDAGGQSESSRLWGLRGGKVVQADAAAGTAAPGPLGRAGYSLRSLAVGGTPRRFAAVSQNGSSLFLAPGGEGADDARAARALRGTDLLRPSFDLFGDVWVVDRTRSGAQVWVLRDGKATQLRVPGVTGATVAAFSMARDGSRIVFGLAGDANPTLRIADILRGDEGAVSGVGQVRSVPSGLVDGARVADIGWRDPATLALLSRPTAETSAVSFVSVDGSPISQGLVEPGLFREVASSLVVSPDVDLPLLIVTPDQRLFRLTSSGQWARSTERFLSAAYGR
ncbi:MAG: LpqB family beta-propeller domain-containing protein [Marmoricola sp.]